MKNLWVFLLFSLAGCASFNEAIGIKSLDVPPELAQGSVMLRVDDSYTMHQAPRSGYDSGDLQNFHSQHTLPFVIEGAFKEIFAHVQMVDNEPQIESAPPNVPAVFEVKMIDIANDIYNEAETYRATATIAVAMKSPKGNIFWQKAFRGDGFVKVDPQFSTGLGPNDAVVDAVRDAVDQMQKAITTSPEVRSQFRYYPASSKAGRQAQESTQS